MRLPCSTIASRLFRFGRKREAYPPVTRIIYCLHLAVYHPRDSCLFHALVLLLVVLRQCSQICSSFSGNNVPRRARVELSVESVSQTPRMRFMSTSVHTRDTTNLDPSGPLVVSSADYGHARLVARQSRAKCFSSPTFLLGTCMR